MLFLMNNNNQNINLSEKNWDYLIKNTNLENQNNLGWNSIMLFIRLCIDEKLYFSDPILSNFFKKSNIQQEKNDGINAFMLYLLNFKHFNFSDEHLLHFVNHKNNHLKIKNFIKENNLEKKLDQRHIAFLNENLNLNLSKKTFFFDKFKKLFIKEEIIINKKDNNYLSIINNNKLTDSLKLKILTFFENLEKIKTINISDLNN